MKDILEALQRRYATKKFDPSKKISQKNIDILLESLRLTPSSFGIQPWKFIVIANQPLKESLVQYSRGQPQIRDCSHLFVLCAKKTIDDEYIREYTNLLEKDWGKADGEIRNNWQEIGKIGRIKKKYCEKGSADQQVLLALGFLLANIATMGIDACPMEGFQPEKYDEVLGLGKSEYKSVVCCAAGYRSQEDAYADLSKVRFPKEQLVIQK